MKKNFDQVHLPCPQTKVWYLAMVAIFSPRTFPWAVCKLDAELDSTQVANNILQMFPRTSSCFFFIRPVSKHSDTGRFAREANKMLDWPQQ